MANLSFVLYLSSNGVSFKMLENLVCHCRPRLPAPQWEGRRMWSSIPVWDLSVCVHARVCGWATRMLDILQSKISWNEQCQILFYTVNTHSKELNNRNPFGFTEEMTCSSAPVALLRTPVFTEELQSCKYQDQVFWARDTHFTQSNNRQLPAAHAKGLHFNYHTRKAGSQRGQRDPCT